MSNLHLLLVIGFWFIVIPVAQSTESSLENANWEIFTNRSNIQELLLSEDGRTLWVGTNGGLEQRDIATGEIKVLFTTSNGLPHNEIKALLSDGKGGIWVGTRAGLAHYTVNNTWEIYLEDNVQLLDDQIASLATDGAGGIWIGTMGGGIAHRYADSNWAEILHKDNSPLPHNSIPALLSDGSGGIWIGTGTFFLQPSNISGSGGGVAHLRSDGTWEVFDTHSGLPDNTVSSLASDSKGGIWVGLIKGGLAHRDVNGQWEYFMTTNSSLPTNSIQSLVTDGQGGLWIGTWQGGLVHFDSTGKWDVFNTDNTPKLPSNSISSLLIDDDQGGLWVGTFLKGLAYYQKTDNRWKNFDYNKLSVPSNNISTLLSDNKGGIWVGTLGEGFAHYRPDGQWQTFDTDNPNLVNGTIHVFMNDNQNGVWIGSYGGLSHLLDVDNNLWGEPKSGTAVVTVLLNDNKGGSWMGTNDKLQYCKSGSCEVVLSDTNVKCLLVDDNNSIWVGTLGKGLAHRKEDGSWEFFDQSNYLPDNNVSALISDDNGGIWLGTGVKGLTSASGGGLLHRFADGSWQSLGFFDKYRSSLSIESLLLDGKGGIYVATFGMGLIHFYFDAEGKATVVNSSLGSFVTSLLPDGNDGIWIGTFLNGLHHLTFTEKTKLCRTTDDSTCQAIQTKKRAAIIIAGGGSSTKNELWGTAKSLTGRLYQAFYDKGFDHDEIYYLSPETEVDFNGDEIPDCIVDAPATNRCKTPELIKKGLTPIDPRPLNKSDIEAAFAWAKQLGKLDYPLYVLFVDHGDTDSLQLSVERKMTAPEFKVLLDDYQVATDNSVISLIDACFSGKFSEGLIDERFQRVLISSTYDTFAFFNQAQYGFSYYFSQQLSGGSKLKEAFDEASKGQQELLGDTSNLIVGSPNKSQNSEPKQEPRIIYSGDSDWLLQSSLNDLPVSNNSRKMTIENKVSSSNVQAGQNVVLAVKISGDPSRAWAVIRPPKMNPPLNVDGNPILAEPQVTLERELNSDSWQGTWNSIAYNGKYDITFYAEDSKKNTVRGDSVLTITVTGGIDPPTQAQVQIHLDKTRYQRGEAFKATLTEDLGWGYDLYAAIVMPDGNYFTLKNTNELRAVKEAKPWYAQRKQSQSVILLDLTLPTDLPTGQYCLYGILSPEQNDVFETLKQNLWVYGQQCFELF